MAIDPASPFLFSWKDDLLNQAKNKNFNLLILFLATLLYFLSLRLAVVLNINGLFPMYFASGIGFSFLLIVGRRLWPAIAIASLVSGYLDSLPWGSTVTIGIANTFEAFFGVLLIQYIFNKLKESNFYSTAFVLLPAAFLAATFGAFFNTVGFCWVESASFIDHLHHFFVWVAARYLGIVALVPFFLSLAIKDLRKESRVLVGVLFILGIALSYLLFFIRDNAAYLFVLFPYILICTIVFDKGAKFLTLLLSVLAIFLTKSGIGPFAFERADLNLVDLQAFLLGISIIGLVASDFKRLSGFRVPGLILMWGSAVSSLVFFTTYTLDHQKVQSTFLEHVDDAMLAVQQQIRSNLPVLRAGVGIVEASVNVNRNEWRQFVKQLRFDQVSSGLQGLGLIYRIEKSKVANFVKEAQKDGAPDFKIKKLSEKSYDPSSSYILIQTEPHIQNAAAEGLDFSTELKRYEAAMLAVDTGDLAISQSVVLKTSNYRERSFLLFYPFYKKGSNPKTIEDRRANHVGWVCAPVMAEDFFAASWSGKPFENLLYSVAESETGKVIASSDDPFVPNSSYNFKRNLNIANRSYVLTFKPSQVFTTTINSTASWAGIGAALFSLLLSIFTAYVQIDKQKAIQRVKEQTQQLELTGQMAKLGGWSYDLATTRVYLSNSAKIIYNFSGEFFPNLQSAVAFFKEGKDRDEVSAAIQRCLQKGIPFDLELESLSAKNETRWVRIIGEAEYKDQKISRILGALQDITERIKLENEKTLIIDSLNVGIWKYYPLSKKLFWDRSMYDLYNLDPKDFSGDYNAWESTLDEKSKESAVKELDRSLEQGSDYNATFLIKSNSGNPRYIGARAVIIRNAEGRATEVYGINWDRTKEVLLEQQLMQERVKTLHSIKMASLGEMSAGVAHEINNPLSIISGSTELLLKFAHMPEKFQERVELIQRAAKRIERIVSGLNKFSRNANLGVRAPASAESIVNEALLLAEVKAKRNNTKIFLEINSKSQILCDRFEIEQVLVNLISNGIDAAKNSTANCVKVQCFDEGNVVVFSVTDSGEGIPDKVRDRIFEPFFTTKKVGEGTGLGLPISKGIIDEHGATIALLETPHTCFEIRFPIEEIKKDA